jgi:hypothetical protein
MTAAFRAPRNLQEIFGSGFEIVRIRASQWRVTAGFRVYDKGRAIWRSNSFIIQKVLMLGFETKIENLGAPRAQ